jgi:hypothetical protein
MAIRPVDLQQVVAKSVDVTRDTAAQQQGAIAAQQTLAEQLKKRAIERTETVSQFDEEAATASVHERRERQRQQQDDPDRREGRGQEGPEPQAPINQQNASKAVLQPRVGRHVDMSA